MPTNVCPGGGMVDAGDLKSLASNGVRVRVPPRVLYETVVRMTVLTMRYISDRAVR